MSLFTVLGASGFIGQRLSAYLKQQGHDVQTPPRDISHLRDMELGHVIYCIGTTGNFRQYPQKAVEAHVGKLQDVMEGAVFDSWLYLSSTRIYGGLPADVLAQEDSTLPLRPSADALYDLTKLLGEAICLGRDNPAVRIARLSNVYGQGQSRNTFLGAVLRDVIQNGHVKIGEDAQSGKDYISVDDAVFFLKEIALKGSKRVYNVASGTVVRHGQIADVIRQSGKEVTFAEGGVCRSFAPIDNSRLVSEFGAPKGNILNDLPLLLSPVSI